MKKYFLILSIVFTFIIGYSQTYDVSINGQITEIGTGIPISNQYVHISNEGSPGGTTHDNIVYTNADGYYFDTLVAPINTVGVINVTVYGCNNIYMDTESYSPNIYNLVFDFEICNDSSGAACEAYFSAAIFTGELNVQFYDESMGNPIQWLWNFGDGNTSTDQNPMHTFDEFGYHTVSLTITDTANECTSTVEQIILIDSAFPPICEADYFAMQDTNNLRKFYFYDASTVPAGQSVIWNWTFGDGNTSTEQNPVHTYAEEGDYGVCLTIQTNDFTCDSWLCDTVTAIEIINPCLLSFIYQEDEGLTIIFEGFLEGGSDATNYYWDFGDGTTDSGQTVTHTYPQDSMYLVTLTASDMITGCQSIMYQHIYVGNVTIGFTGTIYLGNMGIADYADVHLLTFDTTSNDLLNIETTQIDENGYYAFEGAAVDNYIYFIQAELKQQSAYFGQYIPTYHENTISWESATALYPASGGNTFPVYMVNATNGSSGNGLIVGSVTAESTRDALQGVEIILLNSLMEPLNYYFTDDEGMFTFSELELGTYYIQTERVGIYSDLIEVILTEEVNTTNINIVIRNGEAVLGIYSNSIYINSISDLYPNPAYGNISLTIDSKGLSITQIDIYDQYGKLISSNQSKLNVGVNKLNLNLESLSNGVYYLTITSQDDYRLSKKFIKIR